MSLYNSTPGFVTEATPSLTTRGGSQMDTCLPKMGYIGLVSFFQIQYY